MFTLNSCVLKGFVHPFAESADLYALFLVFLEYVLIVLAIEGYSFDRRLVICLLE